MPVYEGTNTGAEPGGISGHKVIIELLEDGFIVTVGCKRFARSTWGEVVDGLTLYWNDPKAAYRHYVKAEAKNV